MIVRALVFLAIGICVQAQVDVRIANVDSTTNRFAIQVTNNTTVALEAFAISWSTPKPPPSTGQRISWNYTDSLLQVNMRALPKAASMNIPVTGDGTATSVQFRAAVFQDGTSVGDAQWVNILLDRRRQYARALDAFLAELNSIPSSSTQADVAERMKARRDIEMGAISLPQSAGGDPMNVESLSAHARRQAVQSAFILVNTNVQKLPTTSNGDQLSLAQTLDLLRQTLTQKRTKLPAGN